MKFLRALLLLAAVAIVVAVAWFYHWIIGSPALPPGQQSDYYNLLVDGFQDGSLAMKVTPDPWLGKDPAKVQHYLLDASFYNGKYYLYFGVTPALLVFWPWTAITGHDLPEGIAAAILAGIAYLLSIGWLATLRRRFFPHTGAGYWLLAVALLGVATGYPVVLRRALFYETAIFSGVACSFATLWCLTLALLRPAQAVRWLAAASLGVGLAAGSRPTLLPGGLLAVAVSAGWLLWNERAAWSAGRIGRLAAAAVIPAGLCGAGLAWYNWARFGSVTDFGLLHQLGSNGNGFAFTGKNLVRNFSVYYLTPPDFSWYFPFFSPGPKPYGSYQEQVHGQFFFLGGVLLLLGAMVVARGWRGLKLERTWGPVFLVALLWAGVAMVFDCMAPPHANRYQLDFHPILVVGLLAGLGVAGAPGRPRWPAGLATAWCGLVLFFNLCTNFAVHGFFRGTQPQAFERIARVVDDWVWPWHRLVSPRLGGFEAVVKFPEGKPGTMEPIVVTGGGSDMDALMVKYTVPGRARLVFIHLDHGQVEGEEFDLKPGRVQWLKIHLGSLYPPAWHPWYRSLPPDMARAAWHVSVQLDGAELLDRDVVCFPSSANQMRLGERGGFPIGAPRFTGEIERVRGLKANLGWLEQAGRRTGPVRLRLLLPRDRFGATEPLLLAGDRGRVEFLSVTYVRPGVVRFEYLHEGWPAPLASPDLAWDYLQPMDVTVDLGPERLNPDSGEKADGVTVEAAGEIAISQDFATYPRVPTRLYVGCAPWPIATARSMFGGEILPEPPASDEPAALRRAKQALLEGGPVELQVSFPGRTTNQPILTMGAPGIGDGLFVEYLSATTVRFGFDHWGSQATYSEPVSLEPGGTHRLTISWGARVSTGQTVPGHLRIQLDEQVVFDQPVDIFPADPSRVFFGANPIGLSTSAPEFSGKLEFRSRSRPKPALTNP